MPRYAQLVVGPAGSGKSTYCKLIQVKRPFSNKLCLQRHHNMFSTSSLYLQDHLNLSRRQCIVVNLDPAAEFFNYEAHVDIRSEIIDLLR